MNCVVTGAAGFIGSHLCEQLLQAGHDVLGIDCFIPSYARAIKERNLTAARRNPRFDLRQADLRSELDPGLFDEVEVVFHLAALPGLSVSWTHFDACCGCNLQATQRLLEALRRAPRLQRLVHASTSSVYGRLACGDESLPTQPISPYGATKLAAEHLCRAYWAERGLPVVVLRYYSVYGPRQRPDMGYHRFIQAALRGEPVQVYGDGEQLRGNTYVDDCVSATMAAVAARPGEIYNVGGGEAVSVRTVLRKLERLAGRAVPIQFAAARPGDQHSTLADFSKLRAHLGWQPRTCLDNGLARQWQWQEQELAKQRTHPDVPAAAILMQ
jgi:nucleoside-diphosphate-sugar epimerase